jgi:hypothetical protein
MKRQSRPPTHVIHFLHYQDCPLHTRRDQLVSSGAAHRPAKEIVRRLHVQAGENRSHDADDALAGRHPSAYSSMFVFCSLVVIRCILAGQDERQ